VVCNCAFVFCSAEIVVHVLLLLEPSMLSQYVSHHVTESVESGDVFWEQNSKLCLQSNCEFSLVHAVHNCIQGCLWLWIHIPCSWYLAESLLHDIPHLGLGDGLDGFCGTRGESLGGLGQIFCREKGKQRTIRASAKAEIPYLYKYFTLVEVAKRLWSAHSMHVGAA